MNQEKTPFPERRAAVAHHFRHVHKVCPYSGAAVIRDEITYTDLPEEVVDQPEEYGAMLEEELGRFLSDSRRKMLFLLMDKNFQSHDETHQAMKRLYVELYTAGQRVGGTQRGKDPHYPSRVRDHFKLELEEPRAKIHPVLNCGFDKDDEPTLKDSFFTMGLSPLYSPTHPRFSPQPAFTLTRSTVLSEIQERDPTIGLDIRGRTTKALLSELYPDIPYEELSTHRIVAIGDDYRLGVDIDLNPKIDEGLAYNVIAQYDKSMYIYPPKKKA